MSARLIAYLPESAALEGLITRASVRIGRAPDNDLVLAHGSISREHALLEQCGDGWILRDLGSKNGSYFAGRRITEQRWQGPAWLRLGDVHCEFTPLSSAALAQAEQRVAERRSASAALTQQVELQRETGDLLHATLAAVVELAGCERGFLLLAESGRWALRACQGLDGRQLRERRFSGSLGAVERSQQSRRPVVLNDIGMDTQLAERPSVISGGLRTLVCLPLLLQDEVLGVVYADSSRPGAVITELELQLLSAFAERAGLWLAARRAQSTLATFAGQCDRSRPELAGVAGLPANESD